MTAMLIKHAIAVEGFEHQLQKVQLDSGLIVDEFVKQLGWSRATWYNLVGGKRDISLEQVRLIERTFNVNFGIKVTIEL